MRKRDAFAAARWHVMTPKEANSEIPLPPGPHSPRAEFMFELRSKENVLVEFVTDDGLMVFVGHGPVVSYMGPVVGFKSLNLHGKVGKEYAYKAYYHGPKRLFETPDPVPLSVSIQSAHKPDIRDYVSELVERQVSRIKAKYGIDVDPEDLAEDVADNDYEWDGEVEAELPFENFGKGWMEPDPPTPVDEVRREANPDSPSPDQRTANPSRPKPPAAAGERPSAPPAKAAKAKQVDLEELIDESDGREPGSTAT